MTDLYRLRESRGWKDDEYIDQLRNGGVLVEVTIDYEKVADAIHEVADRWCPNRENDIEMFKAGLAVIGDAL